MTINEKFYYQEIFNMVGILKNKILLFILLCFSFSYAAKNVNRRDHITKKNMVIFVSLIFVGSLLCYKLFSAKKINAKPMSGVGSGNTMNFENVAKQDKIIRENGLILMKETYTFKNKVSYGAFYNQNKQICLEKDLPVYKKEDGRKFILLFDIKTEVNKNNKEIDIPDDVKFILNGKEFDSIIPINTLKNPPATKILLLYRGGCCTQLLGHS